MERVVDGSNVLLVIDIGPSVHAAIHKSASIIISGIAVGSLL